MVRKNSGHTKLNALSVSYNAFKFFYFFPSLISLYSHYCSGKSTLTESLTEALGATLLKSPPQCLSPWRARFDTEPPLIRRAFYALGNYLTAGQIGQEARQAPVIVDR